MSCQFQLKVNFKKYVYLSSYHIFEKYVRISIIYKGILDMFHKTTIPNQLKLNNTQDHTKRYCMHMHSIFDNENAKPSECSISELGILSLD